MVRKPFISYGAKRNWKKHWKFNKCLERETILSENEQWVAGRHTVTCNNASRKPKKNVLKRLSENKLSMETLIYTKYCNIINTSYQNIKVYVYGQFWN